MSFLRKDIPDHIVKLLLKSTSKRARFFIIAFGTAIFVPTYYLFRDYKLVRKEKKPKKEDGVKTEVESVEYSRIPAIEYPESGDCVGNEEIG